MRPLPHRIVISRTEPDLCNQLNLSDGLSVQHGLAYQTRVDTRRSQR